MFLLLGATTMDNEEAIQSSTLAPSPEEIFENTVLIPCTICGRTFKSESLQKHQAVCQKNATKKRRVFDSMKQRIQGTELAEYIPIPVVPPKPKLIPINKVAAKKLLNNDHRTDESPSVGHPTNTPASTEKTPVKVAVARSNSTGTHGAPRGGGAAFREERCPHCDRTFGWKAFSRHEEWCREHKSRLAQVHSPAAVIKAKEMLEARTKYRAPALGKSKRPTNREKYAGASHSSPAVHAVHRLSVDESPILSSVKATVSSTKKVIPENRNRVASKGSVVQTPSNSGPGNTPRRGLSPSKKMSHVIHNPWKQNIIVDQGGDENLSPPPSGRSRNKISLDCAGDHEEDYDKVFGNTPVLKYSEDNSRDEELLRWIKSVKAMLIERNKTHSKKESKKRSVESPVSPFEDEVRHWETESTASDERMKRTFVYKPLHSSDESSDDKVRANYEEVSQQNEELNVHLLKETKNWMKSNAFKNFRIGAPAESTQTLGIAKGEAVPPISANSQTSVGNHNGELSNHLQSQMKKGNMDKFQPKSVTSSISCDVSVNATIYSGNNPANVTKKFSMDSYLGDVIEKGRERKRNLVKMRSKLPVPVSKFCGQQKIEIKGTTKDNFKDTINGLPTDCMIYIPKHSSKNFNNTFILPKKALEECGLSVQIHSDRSTPDGIEVNSLESSSRDTSPLLQKGIIHECGPDICEINIPSDECKILGKNISRTKSSSVSGNHCSEETSIPVHLLVKNNYSSHENSNMTEWDDDFNDEVHEDQINPFEAAILWNHHEVEAKKKGSQVEFNDSDAFQCKTNDDALSYHPGNLMAKKEAIAVPHCCLFDNPHDHSPLEVEDLATEPLTLNGGNPNSKITGVLSYKNDIELSVTSSYQSIKVHHQRNNEGKTARSLDRRLGNSKKRISPVSSHTGDVHSEDNYGSPESLQMETPQLVCNEELIPLDEEALEGSRKNKFTQSRILNLVSTPLGNVSSRKGLSGVISKRYLMNGQSEMHATCHQRQERKSTSQMSELSLGEDHEFPKDLGGVRLKMGLLSNGSEVTVCGSVEFGMSTRSVASKAVDGNVLGSGEHLVRARGQMRKGVILSRRNSSSMSIPNCLSKENASVGGNTCEGSSASYNTLPYGSGDCQENTPATSLASKSLCSNAVFLHTNQSSISNLKTSKIESVKSIPSKWTVPLCDLSDAGTWSSGNTQDRATISADASSVSLSKTCRRGKLRNQKHRQEANSKVQSGLQEKNEVETASILPEQPSPVVATQLSRTSNGRFTLKGSGHASEMPLGLLPSIEVGIGFEGVASLQDKVEGVACGQRKWLNLIQRLSESEVDCVESLEEVVKASSSNENLFLQRTEIVEKSRSVGLTLSDHKAAEDRIKSRLRGAHWRHCPSSLKLRSPPCAWGPVCSSKTVALSPVRPMMDANDKPSQPPIPSSPLLLRPNQMPLLSSPVKSPEKEEKGTGESEAAPLPPPSQHSTYDPYSRAEMQLKELLSDGSEAQVAVTLPATMHPDGQATEVVQNGTQENPENISTQTNGSVHIHEVYTNQKKAKEVELPDLFTETSAQLVFEMPNVMRSRDRCMNTKRRSLKPTAQNMGIELNSIGRESSVRRRGADHSKNISNKFEDEEVEQITSIMNTTGFCIPRMSSRGTGQYSPGEELDIDSIHQSINLVALGLTNLSSHSQESLVDKDNNNECGGGRGDGGVDFSGNVLKGGESSGDSNSEGVGGGQRRLVPPRAAAGGVEGDVQERRSLHESLLLLTSSATYPLPSVDSAYSSLNRPAFRTIEQAKEAMIKAFDLPRHSSSSEGENDHPDDWSGNEGLRKANQNRWNVKTDTSASVKYAKFCHNCGSKYPLTEAKFCCVCGAQRLAV